MTIVTLKNGTSISHTEAINALQKRIDKYADRLGSIPYVCQCKFPMLNSKVKVKIGCKQRIEALKTTRVCIARIEAAALNNEPAPAECKTRARRSLSHIFGALKKEASL